MACDVSGAVACRLVLTMTRTELLRLLALAATLVCSLAGGEDEYDSDRRKVYHNHFAVVIPGGVKTADEVATKYGFNNLGKVS